MDLRLKEILVQKGITLKEFSRMAGISQSNLSNYINGNISPTLDTLKKIANCLNVDVVELFKKNEDIEFYVKMNGTFFQINKSDIVDLILKRK